MRTLSALAVVILVCVGLALHTGTGTPSAWGVFDIASICPLGGFEALLASKTVVPPLLIALAVGVALVVIFGRAFCAWGCPVPLLKRVFGVKDTSGKRAVRVKRGHGDAQAQDVGAPAVPDAATSVLDVAAKDRGGATDPRNWILGGTVLTTAVFGFPVFCLICPVGLTFATVIALWRLVQFNEVVLSLLVFPAMLVLEVVVLRKWCSRFCPLGALLSLVSRLNKTLRPVSNPSACLRTSKGEACHQCADVCPEGIDLHHRDISAPMNECTKCRACADACPMHAITFPFLPGKDTVKAKALTQESKGETAVAKDLVVGSRNGGASSTDAESGGRANG